MGRHQRSTVLASEDLISTLTTKKDGANEGRPTLLSITNSSVGSSEEPTEHYVNIMDSLRRHPEEWEG